MTPDLGQPIWIEQLPPAHDYGHGVNQQRKAIADRAIEPEQQREGEYQLGNAQGIRCRHRQRYSVKVAGDALRRFREDELLDTPLQQKNRQREPQDEKRGRNAIVDFRRHGRLLGHAPCSGVAFALLTFVWTLALQGKFVPEPGAPRVLQIVVVLVPMIILIISALTLLTHSQTIAAAVDAAPLWWLIAYQMSRVSGGVIFLPLWYYGFLPG